MFPLKIDENNICFYCAVQDEPISISLENINDEDIYYSLHVKNKIVNIRLLMIHPYWCTIQRITECHKFVNEL